MASKASYSNVVDQGILRICLQFVPRARQLDVKASVVVRAKDILQSMHARANREGVGGKGGHAPLQNEFKPTFAG